MATAQAAEKVTDLLQNLKVDPGRGDRIEVPSNRDASIQNATLEAAVVDATNIPVAYEAGMDARMYYAVNGFAAPPGYYYGGFECTMGDWDDYMRHVSADGAESQNLGVYNENGPLLYHPASYGYGPQHLYGPYTPGAPIPPMRPDGQFYAPQGYPYSGHVYQQPVPPNAPFVPPSSAAAGVAAPTVGTGESTSDGLAGTAVSGNSGSSGTRSGHVLHSSGPTGRGILPVNVPVSGSQDVRAGPPWLNYSKVTEVQPKHGLPQAIPVSGQSVRPVAPLMPHIPSGHHYRPPPAVAAAPGTLGRAFQPSARMHRGLIAPGRVADTLGTSGLEPRGNAHNWIAFDKGKPWGRGNVMMSNGGSSMDVLNEQNRGPRTTRMRNQRVAPSAVRYMPEQGVTNGTPEAVTTLANKDHYNHPDFATNYDNAKCFIIKSYSEDDIHKSIKYGVWASTANGNKKLDAAYQEAQASSGYCPLFLFFSVNASGQFCGVAEMVGPVDFNKSLDFWQQDKWSGKLPVKWHIVKDVPNNQFRHIILENNDNKPVTNSRDTQEVRFDQALEMLNIFKNFVFKTSILDDFQFYENRQKAMQEKRARQQAYFQLQRVAYRDNKDLEQRSSREDASSILQKGGRPVEVGQCEKSVKLKDGQAGSITGDECNGISADEKRARQQAYMHLQQVVFRESKDLQQKSSREDALGILQKGGRPDETVQKPVKLKDGRVASSVSEKCNGTSSDEARLDKCLSRSESRDSQAGGVESLLGTKDTMSVSGKSISELSGKI